MELEKCEPQLRRRLKRELASVLDFDSFTPFDLHGVTPWKGLPQHRLAKGQELALAVGEGVVEFDRSAREDLKCRKDLDPGWADRGPQWPELLNELTWLADRALLDYIEPDWKEPKFSEELIARDVLSYVEKDQESHGSKKIRDYLRDIDPPLTWGEVVYHVLCDSEMSFEIPSFIPHRARYFSGSVSYIHSCSPRIKILTRFCGIPNRLDFKRKVLVT